MLAVHHLLSFVPNDGYGSGGNGAKETSMDLVFQETERNTDADITYADSLMKELLSLSAAM